MAELAYKTATELAADIRAKRIGCVELLEHYLAREARFNPALNCIVVKDVARARERAKAADSALSRGETWGPLHGVPMTIKESYNVAGLPTTWGVPGLRNNVPTANAVMVDRLLGAGAIIYGKTNVPLLLADSQSYNEIYGTTNNPWDVTRVPGGSSGGSAASLAAGLSALDGGSDIGGSLRNPAHYCGVYAHKPTHGIVPIRGHAPADIVAVPDLSVVGPMARSAEDLALAMDVVAGPDLLQAPGWKLDLPAPRAEGLKGLRVAVWADDPLAPVDRTVATRIDAAIEALARAGARIDTRARPSFDAGQAHLVYMRLLRAVTTARQPVELFEENKRRLATLSPDDQSAAANAVRGSTLYHREWLAYNEERTKMRWAWHGFFKEHDVLLAPVGLTAAFPHNQEPDRDKRFLTVNGRPVPYQDQLFWAGLATTAYLPATSAPIGLTPEGLPVGLQIVGPELADRQTIDVARLLAQEIGGFTPPPGYA
jgi:amidase